MKKEFRIHAGAEKSLEKALARLNKHAQKMGYSACSLISVGEAYETKQLQVTVIDGEQDERDVVYLVRDVVVDLPEQFLNPVAAEWSVIGQLLSAEGQVEVVAEPANFKKVNDAIPLAEAGGFKFRCSRCRHPLLKAYAVEHKVDHTILFVGQECLKQYTGADGEAILKAIEFLNILVFEEGSEFRGEGKGEGRSYISIDLEEYLAMCQAIVELEGSYKKRWVEDRSGWESGFVEAPDCTRNYALSHFLGRRLDVDGKPHREYSSNSGQVRFLEVTPTEIHKLQAEQLVKGWIEVETPIRDDGKPDSYIEQCKILAERGWISEKTAGVAASMVKGAPKKIEKVLSNYVGEVGKRMDLIDLTVIFTTSWEGEYGTTTLVKFVDPVGNIITWFASGDKKFEKGEKWSLKATVKAHDEYKGDKQTVITRAKPL